ncbi:hypothetical protein EDC18_101375 [Natranaerovirga pectinivora]|uniref:Uncharacterized protein n=1 Tax=Natranaerovirga pectinivora TaxID=682400 RepID=A0A4V2V0N8_9FIRM|nr:hypothetical protein EDC18_101375 [Natranaerovirga pectinivora]
MKITFKNSLSNFLEVISMIVTLVLLFIRLPTAVTFTIIRSEYIWTKKMTTKKKKGMGILVN